MKALARRGEAHEKLEHYEEAIAGKFGFNIIVKTIIYIIVEFDNLQFVSLDILDYTALY